MTDVRLTEAQFAALRAGKPLPKVARGAKWEDLFAAQLHAAGVGFVREHRLLADRRYRLDFAMLPLSHRVGLEIDGVVHRIKGRFISDREKGNIALLHGWRILHVSPADVREGRALALLQSLLATSCYTVP